MKLILFLDDSPERAAIAYQRMLSNVRDRVIWCATAEEAITTLKDYVDKLEVVMLDHDLGGYKYMNSKSEESGMEVIRFLEHFEDVGKLKKTIFVVHTHNIEAGKIMVERLKKLRIEKVIHSPFGE